MEKIKEEIVAFIKKDLPQTKSVKAEITGVEGGVHFGRTIITSDRFKGKEFSVGFLIYSVGNSLWTFTSSPEDIIRNYKNFK